MPWRPPNAGESRKALEESEALVQQLREETQATANRDFAIPSFRFSSHLSGTQLFPLASS